jgi:DNA-binding transcriptional regulator YhcF (GntR family)
MFQIDATSIDKSLPVPVGAQLYGLLSYVLAFGDVPSGTKLRSVRQMAADLGIAPMTVSQVYRQLRAAGLIEMRPGLGVFTAGPAGVAGADASPAAALRADIEVLLGKAERLGIPPLALVATINAQAALRRQRAGLSIVFAVIFERPGQDYLDQIRPVLAADDRIRMLTIDTLTVSEEARGICRAADLVLTFVHREAEVRALLPGADVLALKFIPSAKTRMALAGLDPRSRVAAVTHFKDYIAIMRPSIRDYAPHVRTIRVTWSAAPDLAETIAGSDAVVFASGADHVADLVPPGVPCFEFRHAPDPSALETLLVPHLAELRRRKLAGNEAAPGATMPAPASIAPQAGIQRGPQAGTQPGPSPRAREG